MTARAGSAVIPVAPPMLGDVLGSPVAYAEAMIAGQTPCPFPSAARPGRPGRARGTLRRLAARVALLAAAGLAATGWAGGTPVAQRSVRGTGSAR
jgi:hypothetical protein